MDDKTSQSHPSSSQIGMTDLERASAWLVEHGWTGSEFNEFAAEPLASLLATVRREERERALEEAASAVDSKSGSIFVGSGAAKERIRALKAKP